jgi:FG-GAP-like repeat/FG-GAP repeat/FlgD Ig-like domain
MKIDRIAAHLGLALAALVAARPQPAGADVLAADYILVREGNANNAMLGFCVATAGDVNGDGYSDVLLTGAQGNGTVWCYHASVDVIGTVGFTEEWVLSGGAPNALLNARVAPAGDVNGDGYGDVLIGAPLYSNGEFNEGAVFVYLGSDSGLAATSQRFIEGNIAGAALGSYVDTAGDVNGDGFDDIVVGSPNYSNGESFEGRALVFLGSPAGIAASPVWSFESNSAFAYMGKRVAGSGDVNADGYDEILVSAPELTDGQNGEGRVCLFYGSASGPAISPSWTYDSNIVGGRAGWGLGCAGDVNGDGYSDMVFDIGTNNPAPWGGVYVFFGGVVLPARSFTSGSGAFGDMVYTAGDINGDGFSDLIAGDMSVSGQAGKITILGGVEAGSTFPVLAERYGAQAGEQFGADCRSAGDVNGDGFGDVIVGVPRHDNGSTDEGQVRVYLGRAGAPNLSAAWSPQGSQTLSEFGSAVAQGDWNGDGYTDLAVGAHDQDVGATNSGSVSVYYGGFYGYASGASWVVSGTQSEGHFGFAVANAGDIDNDGSDELIVGEPYYGTFDFPDVGAVHIFKGSMLNGLGTTPWWYQTGGIQPSTFGFAVAGAGDVNGDGYADVVIGAPNHEFAPFERGGAAYLYFGSAEGLSTNAVWTGFGGATGDRFGASVAGVGDLNADGFGDIVVGAPNKESSPSLQDEGYAFFFFGSSAGISNAWTQRGDQAGGLYGLVVAAGGDFLADGYSDALVGAPFYDPDGILDGGVVDAYVGTPTFDVGFARRYQGSSPGAKMGSAVAGGGDVNGDGRSDIAIGAAGDDYGYPDGGAVYVYTCGQFGYCDNPDPVWVNWGTESYGQFGQALSMAGDGTGDGFADLIVGQPVYQNRSGRAYCFYGAREGMPANEDGCKRIPIQTKESGVWIRPLGASDLADGFRIHTLARSARGRSTLEVLYQIAEPENWIGSATSAGSFDTGDPNGPWGSAYSAFVTVSGLDPETPYRWRMRTVGDSPYFPLSPWFSIAGNAPGETDLRTGRAVTGVEASGGDGAGPGARFVLTSIGPNPCRDEATIWFSLPEAGAARLTVHDVSGRHVATLVDGALGAGAQTASWDTRDAAGRRVAAGVYLLRLERGESRTAAKLIVQR